MRFYFQAGKNKRLAINTETNEYCNNYFYLGAYHEYIKISVADYNALWERYVENYYMTYSENF